MEEHEVERDPYRIEIPQCCREGWDDCPHVVNRVPERVKRNVGL